VVRVNTSVKIYKEVKTWDGHVANELVGEYGCWMEEGSSLVFVRGEGGRIGVTEVGRGTLFLWEDIDLTSCFFIADGRRCEVMQFYRYVDGKGKFHHMEVIYK